MNKHTPGPWRIAATDDTRVLARPRRTICTTDAVDHDWSEAEANARLIAAAPDLLRESAALKEQVAEFLMLFGATIDPKMAAALFAAHNRMGAAIAAATKDK